METPFLFLAVIIEYFLAHFRLPRQCKLRRYWIVMRRGHFSIFPPKIVQKEIDQSRRGMNGKHLEEK